MMNPQIPEYLLDDLTGYIARHTGLDFPARKRRALQKAIFSVAAELSHAEPHGFVRQLLDGSPSAQTLDTLVKHLTVGETYFFRDKYLFQLLKADILRGLLQHPRRVDKSLRIWSAGCASGEEAYSVAILLDQMANRLRDFRVTIIGTDINPFSLNKAEKGAYTRWSFRDTPDAILNRYFRQTAANTFEILPRIKQMVEFRRLNFVDDDYSTVLKDVAPFDIVLCRNVIMYFNKHVRNTVIRRLNKMIEKNGWLIVGPAETSFVHMEGLTAVRFPNAVFHRNGPPRLAENKHVKNPGPALANAFSASRPDAGDETAGPGREAAKPERRKSDKSGNAPQKFDLYQSARLSYDKGRYRSTIQILEPILSGSESRSGLFLMLPESMALMARAHANLGDLKSAEHWCNAAIAEEKLNPEYYYLLASIYQADNRLSDAIKAVRRLLYLDPQFIMGHFTLGMLMRQSNRPREAIKPFENALALLAAMKADQPVDHSEGLSVGHLQRTIHSLMPQRKTANDR